MIKITSKTITTVPHIHATIIIVSTGRSSSFGDSTVNIKRKDISKFKKIFYEFIIAIISKTITTVWQIHATTIVVSTSRSSSFGDSTINLLKQTKLDY